MKNLKNIIFPLLILFIFALPPSAFPARAAPVKVGIINLSDTTADKEVEKITEALQIQTTRDYAPVYKQDAEVKFYKLSETVPEDVWKIYLVQKYNYPELGFHYVNSFGVPEARVSLERSNEWGKPASLVLSHELLEMLANPYVDRSVVVSSEKSDHVELYLFEVSDAVMGVNCSYKINDVIVSDFVYPWWFDQNAKQTKFSHSDCVKKPLKIARAGYMPYMKLFKNKKGFAQWKRKT